MEMEQSFQAESGTGRLVELSRSMLTDVTQALQEINDINRTVHILSMNARVEAARAGDAGRGFAVVASELTRLSSATQRTTKDIEAKSKSTGSDLQWLARQLTTTVTDTRLCDLAHHAMDLIDRNLYERSCDVRWWATETALVNCASNADDKSLAQHASLRLGQILDSYTVYADLVLADMHGRVLCNGRPRVHPHAADADVSREPWFRAAMGTRSGSEFGFQAVHECSLVGGERALVYSCTVRANGQVDRPVLGVLGIIFRWDALGLHVLRQLPLTEKERATTQVTIVDGEGWVMADVDPSRIGRQLRFDGLGNILKSERGAETAVVEGRRVRVCYASAPGFETYTTNWHCLLLRQLD